LLAVNVKNDEIQLFFFFSGLAFVVPRLSLLATDARCFPPYFSSFSDSMPVAHPAASPTTFEIKSANLPLVALLLKSSDLETLAREMADRFADEPDFFDQDALMIDLAPLQVAGGANEVVDFTALIALLTHYQLVPVAIKGGSPPQMMAALQAGLLLVPDAHLVGTAPRTPASAPVRSERAPEPAPAPAPAPVAAPSAVPSLPLGALVIDKPVRSGQQIYARGRDLVMLAMVNAGAEVIADGHIHVYAPLRGKAMAGARGNIHARIFALELSAELLSIAGVYRTSEHPLPEHVQGKPAQVRLLATADGESLVMDSM
jgi:septum site-determining protein MinC